MNYNTIEDGVTHLNLYSKANTELGRFCSNFAYSPIETEDGHFDSIEGYWGWLSVSEDWPTRENFRNLFGFEAKQKKDVIFNQGDPGRFEPEFSRKIRDAIHLKFQTKEAKDLMYKYRDLISLPLCHYYVYKNNKETTIVDETEKYPEFINSIQEEFNDFLKNHGAMFGVCKGIICQQVNCQGVMGAGLAKIIMEEHPEVYSAYMETFEKSSKENLFGKVNLVPIGEDLYIANIFSQFNYGNPAKTGKIYTDADKLVKAVESICKKFPNLPVYLPHTKDLEGRKEYGIGCGYGGETWDKLSAMFRNLGMKNLHLLDTRNGIVHEIEVNELQHTESKYPFCKGMSKLGEEMEQYQADLAVKYKYEPLKGEVKKDALETYIKTLPPCFHGNLRELRTGYEVQGKKQPLFLKDGTKIANGYTRIVIGHYGAFIEIEEKDVVKDKMEAKKGEEYRLTPKYIDNVKYSWLTVGDTQAKIYEQKKGVSYADYKPGRYYISPYEVMDKKEMQGILEQWNSEFLPFEEKEKPEQIDLKIDPALYEGLTIAFDMETTGFSSDKGDEPLQIAIVNENEEIVLSTYLKPYFKTSWPGAQKVNNISPEMVSNAPHIDELSDILQDIFNKATGIVGHNVAFDVRFVENCGKVSIDKEKLFDTCLYFKEKVPESKHNLEYAVLEYCPMHYDEYKSGAHDALTDTIATVRVFNEIQKMQKKEEIANGEQERV